MGIAAANRSAVSFYRTEGQAAARKDAGIGIIHGLVAFIQTGFIPVEGIQILHDKFSAPHQAKPRTPFITIFILNLV